MASDRVDENCPIHGKAAIRKEMIISTLPTTDSKLPMDSCMTVETVVCRRESPVDSTTPNSKWSDEWLHDGNDSDNSTQHDEIESVPLSTVEMSRDPLTLFTFDLNDEKSTRDTATCSTDKVQQVTDQTASQLALANIDIEMRDFELQKHRKINETLLQSIEKRDETIAALQEKIWEFEKFKQSLEATREHLNRNNRAIDDIKTSLVAQNLNEKCRENSVLCAKLAEAEQITAEKDKLIASLNKQVLKAQLDNQHLKHEIHSLQSGQMVLKESMGTLANNFKGKEMQLQLATSKRHQEELAKVMEQIKDANALVKQRDNELAKCRRLLELAEQHFTRLVDKNKTMEQTIKDKTAQVETYKNAAIELECKMVQVDKSSQLQAALATVSKLKAKCHQLQLKLEANNAMDKYANSHSRRQEPLKNT